MTVPALIRQIAEAGGRVWMNGEAVRITASGPRPDALIEELRREKAGIVEVLRLMPVCCGCGAKIIEPVCAWLGGRPVHLDCGKRAWASVWIGGPKE